VTGEEFSTVMAPLDVLDAVKLTSLPAVTGAFVVTWIAPPFAISVTFPLVAVTDVVAHSGELAGDSSDTVIAPPAVKLTLSTASTFAVLRMNTLPDAIPVMDELTSAGEIVPASTSVFP
jgi:tRNA A37 threonylcarbamoyltransferase TsaD